MSSRNAWRINKRRIGEECEPGQCYKPNAICAQKRLSGFRKDPFCMSRKKGRKGAPCRPGSCRDGYTCNKATGRCWDGEDVEEEIEEILQADVPDAVKIAEVAMVAKAAPAAAMTALQKVQMRMNAPWCEKNKWTQRDCGNGTLQKNPYREKMCQEALAKKCIKVIKWKELSNPVLNQLLNIPGVQVYEGKKTDTKPDFSYYAGMKAQIDAKKLGGGGRPCRDGRQCRGIPRDGRRSKYQCRAPRYKFSPNGKRTGKQCRKRLSGGARKKSRSRKKKSRSRKKKSRSRKKKSRSRKKKSRSRKKKSRSRKKKSRRKSRSRKKKSRRKSRKKKSRRKSRRKRSRKRSGRAKGFIGDMRKNKWHADHGEGLATVGLGGGRRRR